MNDAVRGVALGHLILIEESRMKLSTRLAAGAAVLVILRGPLAADSPPPASLMPQPTPNDTLISPETGSDDTVTLRLYAPKAQNVGLKGDLTPLGQSQELSKDDQGVWSISLKDVAPGTYRYHFTLDGASVVDLRNV